ncbi:MAG TPA: alpha/beta hydrolase-fold protein [Bryobacteraceae bacterium]|nr:alpha/beta hydrolase-fold protein [Bryobacteraceae bacterium]
MWRIVAGIIGAVVASAAFGQSLPAGPQVITYLSQVDDSNQSYALYVPPKLDPSRKYPLVISLHAEDSSPQICLMRVFGQANRLADGSLAPLRFFRARDVDFIVACPLARGTMGYEGIAERDVYDVLEDLKRRLPVDEDRVYLTGASMGGGGALRLALTQPDVWAAVAVVCPAAGPGLEPLIPNAINVPIRLFQGELDPLVPVESVRLWQRRLLDLGVAADYFEYPTGRHNAWDYAYRDGAIFEWFAHFQRNRFPERVRLVTTSYQYGSAYWVRIDGLTPGLRASIDARQVGNNEVRAETGNLDGFTLSLDHRVAAVTIDGAPLRVPPAAGASFHKEAGKWVRGAARAGGKGPGSEGPIAAAVAGRHLYVYGTLDAHSADELESRRAAAERAAAWSSPREHPAVKFAVKPDTAVTAQDLNENLVLFGTRETNSVIARYADRLPLALAAGAADYGLLFVAPVGGHYVLVSSGLPWWTGAGEAGRPVDRYEPPVPAELGTFGDYILFKGSLAHVVAEGRFDREWKMPAADAAKMAATGAVTVR